MTITKQQLNKIKIVARHGMEYYGIARKRFWHLLLMIVLSDYWFTNFSDVIDNFFTCCVCGNRVRSGYMWSAGARGYATSPWSGAKAFHLECLFNPNVINKAEKEKINSYVDTFYMNYEYAKNQTVACDGIKAVARSEIKKIEQEVKRVLKDGI